MQKNTIFRTLPSWFTLGHLRAVVYKNNQPDFGNITRMTCYDIRNILEEDFWDCSQSGGSLISDWLKLRVKRGA